MNVNKQKIIAIKMLRLLKYFIKNFFFYFGMVILLLLLFIKYAYLTYSFMLKLRLDIVSNKILHTLIQSICKIFLVQHKRKSNNDQFEFIS